MPRNTNRLTARQVTSLLQKVDRDGRRTGEGASLSAGHGALLAGIALAPDSEAALHTRMMCAKEIVAIAGVIPQPTPAPPALQSHAENVDGGEHA